MLDSTIGTKYYTRSSILYFNLHTYIYIYIYIYIYLYVNLICIRLRYSTLRKCYFYAKYLTFKWKITVHGIQSCAQNSLTGDR